MPMTDLPPHVRRKSLGLAAGAALLETPLARTAEAAARRPKPAGAILLNSNENPYGPSPKALEALVAADPIANRYPDAAEDAMRAAIAKHHGVSPEQVTLGCGSSEILQMADLAFTGPGRKAVAAEPTFEAVLIYAKVLRAEPVTVPLTPDFRHDLPKMAEACAGGAGLVYVCNPNNPTGTIVGGDELAAFAARVPSATTILVDEAYFHFVESPSLPERPRADREAPERRRRADLLEDLRDGGPPARLRGRLEGADRRDVEVRDVLERELRRPRRRAREPHRPRPRAAPAEAPERHAEVARRRDGAAGAADDPVGDELRDDRRRRRRDAGDPGLPRRGTSSSAGSSRRSRTGFASRSGGRTRCRPSPRRSTRSSRSKAAA